MCHINWPHGPPILGDAVGTIEHELWYKLVQTAARMNSQQQYRFAGLCTVLPLYANPTKTPQRPFHGGNTGSNPVGDAKSFQSFAPISCGLRGTTTVKPIRLLSTEVPAEVLNQLSYRAMLKGWLDRTDVRSSTSVWALSGGRPGSKR